MNSGGALESFRVTGSRGFGVSHLTACCFLIQDGPLSPEAGPLVYPLTRVGSLLIGLKLQSPSCSVVLLLLKQITVNLLV